MPAKTTTDRPETKGRPTLYKGIQMRSRLEADYAAYLGRRGHQWEYEPDCFADENGQWLPDFRVTFADDGHKRLIELKPAQLLIPGDRECQNCVIRRVDEIIDRARIAWSTDSSLAIEIVFWTYGAATPNLSIIGSRWCEELRPRGYWAARMPGFEFPFTWSGQGQRDELVAHREPADASLPGDEPGEGP